MGTMTNASGSVYRGLWKENKKNGKVELRSSNGNVYTGEFCNDQKHGRGKFIYAPGTVLEESYNGEWSRNLQNGNGTYTY